MSIKNGWFLDTNSQWPGICLGMEVKEVLHEERTKYQDLLVFESTHWGKVLVLDGVMQLSERDEMSYQEMLAQIPLHSHPDPKRVLIVGGGDGGIMREVCKHPGVQEVLQVEIDEAVPRVCKSFFPSIATAFDDPRVTLKIEDAVKFIEGCEDDRFDVLIVDSSDPDGPAEKLFSAEFYAQAHRILTEDGVMAAQGECYWIHQHLMVPLLEQSRNLWSSAEYATINVPVYPCGQICAFVLSKSRKTCAKPIRPVIKTDMKYYSERMHEASFVLPVFIEQKLGVSQDL